MRQNEKSIQDLENQINLNKTDVINDQAKLAELRMKTIRRFFTASKEEVMV